MEQLFSLISKNPVWESYSCENTHSKFNLLICSFEELKWIKYNKSYRDGHKGKQCAMPW